MSRRLDEKEELLQSLRAAPLLERIEEVELESGPAWELGRVGITKGYPSFETSDLPDDLMPDAAFRKIAFDFPEEHLRGFVAVLTYAREGDREFEVVAGHVPPELERQLDEWIVFLNREIRQSLAAAAAEREGGG